MSKKDVLDPKLVLQFAWRTAATLPQGPPEPPRPDPSLDVERMLAASEHPQVSAPACSDLARRIARAWEMTPRLRQAAATRLLLTRMMPVYGQFLRLAEHPREAVRLWRLGVRHGRTLGEDARSVLLRMPIMTSEPEVMDFIVELVENGDTSLASSLDETKLLESVAYRFPELGARLVQLFENAQTWEACEIAARWSVRVDRRRAVAALRRALRRPVLRLRVCALTTLKPTDLTAEDVQWLLDDAPAHPLPSEAGEHASGRRKAYEAALLEAIKVCAPPEGWRPLAVIADGGPDGYAFQREELGIRWALAALAAGWPDRAAARIDQTLGESKRHRRVDAVEAAALLPEVMARPRLLEGAALPDREAAERAKDLWFARFGEACPVTPLSGVNTALLDGPPSDALLARLTVLRGSSAQAAAKVLVAALAEAPSREALALLLYSLRDFGDAHRAARLPADDAQRAKGFAPDTEAWARTLMVSFGAPAFDGLFALAEREAPLEFFFGWLHALMMLAHRGQLDEAQRDRLRRLAAAGIAAPPRPTGRMLWDVLHQVGAPPSVMERLWAIVLAPTAPDADGDPDPDRESYRFTEAHGALGALEGFTGSPEVDARFVHEATAAMDRGAWETAGRIVLFGARRRIKGMALLALRALRAADHGDPVAMAAADPCAEALEYAGRTGARWLVTTLSRPDSPLFGVATKVVRCEAAPEVVAALDQALDSGAREGRSAAEAATVLVSTEVMAVDDPRLDGILERAPEDARLRLGGVLLNQEATLASVRRHYATLLLSKNARIAGQAYVHIEMCHHDEGTWELFESVLALGPIAGARSGILYHLGEPREAEVYWRELGEEDEEVGSR